MNYEIPDKLKYKYQHRGEPWSDRKIELPKDKVFSTVVTIMRANPPHVNHTAMLRELCEKSIDVKINLGSSNKPVNNKNPFKIEEREEMMKLALGDQSKNYTLLRLPDFGSDEAWMNELFKINGNFSEILSNNNDDMKIYKQYQNNGRAKKYDILVPTDVIGQDKMLYVDGIWTKKGFQPTNNPLYVSGTFVRAAMVNGWGWQRFVDKPVAEYILKNGLIDRLKELCPELKGMPLEKFDIGR